MKLHFLIISLLPLEKNTTKITWSKVWLLPEYQPVQGARAGTGGQAGACAHRALICSSHQDKDATGPFQQEDISNWIKPCSLC